MKIGADVNIGPLCPDVARPIAAVHLGPVLESAGAISPASLQNQKTTQERADNAATASPGPGPGAGIGGPVSTGGL